MASRDASQTCMWWKGYANSFRNMVRQSHRPPGRGKLGDFAISGGIQLHRPSYPGALCRIRGWAELTDVMTTSDSQRTE